MGGRNVLAAYALYAGKVPPLAMQLLGYMAAKSMDDDERPWYGQGHDALAEHALGRPEPITESDRRAVGRVVKPLLEVRAIEVDRPPGSRRDGPRTIRYRLNLNRNGGRNPSGVAPENAGRNPSGVPAERLTDSVPNGNGSWSQRLTHSDRTPDGNRPPEEKEEGEEEGRSRAPARDEPPLPRCPKHIDHDTDRPCHGCGQARRAREAWQAEQDRVKASLADALDAAVADPHQECDHGTPGGRYIRPDTGKSATCAHCRRAEEQRHAS